MIKHNPIKILNVNASDISGGAARAAYRIHRSLVEYGIEHGLKSEMRVINKFSEDFSVIGGPPVGQSWIWQRLQPRLSRYSKKGFFTTNKSLHSTAWPSTGLGSELKNKWNKSEFDLLHLNWLGDCTISIEEIGKLEMPIVWTLLDQWLFCGAEHYVSPPIDGQSETNDKRFQLAYDSLTRFSNERGPDINRNTWLRKFRSWQRPIHIVSPSNWLANCARKSSLTRDWPITVIPFPLDLETWSPVDSMQATNLMGLPKDKKIVLFGAIKGTIDSRKGADLLYSAIHYLSQDISDKSLGNIHLVVFGQDQPLDTPKVDFPISFMGHLSDDISLRLLYAASDVMVVPSRQEGFGQTASEAQACGTPVVAFRSGGLIDVVDHMVTGALANPFDSKSLAEEIKWVLEDSQRLTKLGRLARKRAQKLWDPRRIAMLYSDLFKEIISKSLINN